MFKIIGSLLVLGLCIFMLMFTTVPLIAGLLIFDIFVWAIISGVLIGARVGGE